MVCLLSKSVKNTRFSTKVLKHILDIECAYVNALPGFTACGDLCVAMQSRYLEILDFTQFFDHFVFTPNAENVLEKELKKEIPVSVGIELVVVDMSRNA